eukprot:CAMPEP_0185205258 /NCGR_PEP_ID=MMETSP1140-20130426/56338_1 /TAXON_ID=298111 /ORGANISM="Pavlova sp., Strain CCMP459" /LENGTH=77 /DNA_ID=CAMNT_0027772847 /DNA_START=266 /DNA_END=500 /DNA_ORIENTATION=-
MTLTRYRARLGLRADPDRTTAAASTEQRSVGGTARAAAPARPGTRRRGPVAEGDCCMLPDSRLRRCWACSDMRARTI